MSVGRRSLLGRLLGRPRTVQPAEPSVPPVDDVLERWVDTAVGLMDGMGPDGRLVLALLGDALVDGTGPWWFGYEPSSAGLSDLLAALGEDPTAAHVLVDAEAALRGRRAGRLSEEAHARWCAVAAAAVRDPSLADALVAQRDRDPVHREAETLWRAAARTQPPWRATRLDPDRALRQLRWYPGCPTRTHIGYSDPLGLAAAARSVSEHRWSAEEEAGLRLARQASDRGVDPLVWRLSCLRFAIEDRR